MEAYIYKKLVDLASDKIRLLIDKKIEKSNEFSLKKKRELLSSENESEINLLRKELDNNVKLLSFHEDEDIKINRQRSELRRIRLKLEKKIKSNEIYNENIEDIYRELEVTKKREDDLRKAKLNNADNKKELIKKKIELKQLIVSKENYGISLLNKLTLKDEERYICDLVFSSDGFYKGLDKHISSLKSWASSINFSDLSSSKRINDIYVDLDIYLCPVKYHVDPIEKERSIPLNKILGNTDKHCVILGQPGAGKTTSMKRLVSNYINGDGGSLAIAMLPILIKCRELCVKGEENSILFGRLSDIFDLKLRYKESVFGRNYSNEKKEYLSDVLVKFIDELSPVIIIEGFDELPDASEKKMLLEEIKFLTTNLRKARVVITCRTGEFYHNLDNTETYEIKPLSNEQVREFSSKWFSDNIKSLKFLNELNGSPFIDAIIKPLTLAHLCAIFERIGRIPDKPKTVYRKIVTLLLEEWDEQRLINRKSTFDDFYIDQKFEFLANLAYSLTVQYKSSIFSHKDFVSEYERICNNFSLPDNESKMVAKELESHTGLFIQSGYEQYEFAHKSIQEYLTSEYIVKLPTIPSDPHILKNLGAEMAVSVSISSNPSKYLSELVLSVLYKVDLGEEFYDAFVSRLIIEKPNFHQHFETTISLFLVFTLWLKKGAIERDSICSGIRQVTSLDIDKFKRLLKSVLQKNDIDTFTGYYEKWGGETKPDRLQYARKKKECSGERFPRTLLFPVQLFEEVECEFN